jgi:hypothetical protein
MTDARVFAWIFISVTNRGGALKDLIAQADALMRAIPTHDELQMSLGWLIHRGLVQTQGFQYVRTPAGNDLLNRHRRPAQPAMELLSTISSKVSPIKGVVAPLHRIDPEALRKAHVEYQKEFRTSLKEVLRSDTSTVGALHSSPSAKPPSPPIGPSSSLNGSSRRPTKFE